MSGALEYNKFASFISPDYLVDESVLLVYSTAPASVRSYEGFGFPDSGVAVSLNVLDEKVDSLESFFVFKLPSSIFIPGSRCKSYVHVRRACYASMSLCLLASPRLYDSIDSRSTRWLASDQNGSGSSETTSNGNLRRMTDWRRNRRTALVRSSPVLAKRASASLRRLESILICNVDVAMSKSFICRT